MKITLIYIFWALCSWQSDGFYSLAIAGIEGDQINMSTYAGRKVAILVFDAAAPDSSLLTRADSLQRIETTTTFLAVPAGDLSGFSTDSALMQLHNRLGLSIPFTQSVLVTRGSDSSQHSLFKWLTDVSLNGHFNRDVEAAGQMFLISEQGTLYGILSKEAPVADIVDALHQTISQ